MMIKTVYEEGIEVGLERGIERGQRLLIERLLASRFGPVSEALRQRLAALPAASLGDFAARIGQAESIEALGLAD